jgi:hypothetical protein
MNSKTTFQSQSFMSCSRKHKRVESISVARMDRLCSYLEQDNDTLNELNQELKNKLQELCNKYDELTSKYSILQKENEELKNKSKKQVILPQQPVPQLGSDGQLETEEYVNEDDSTDAQLLDAIISVTNHSERSMGTGQPANHRPYNNEENEYLKSSCLKLGEEERLARKKYDEACKTLMTVDKSSSEFKNLKKERSNAKKKFEKARKNFNGKNIIVLFKKQFVNAKRRQDNHLQQKVTRVKGELRNEGKIPKRTKPYCDTDEAKAFRKSQKEEIETY